MRGAARLAGEGEAMVVDIGGTTSDVGMLNERLSPANRPSPSIIGGVRDKLLACRTCWPSGSAAASIVRDDGARHRPPDSVGYELTEKALVFGGDTLTTDPTSWVAAGLAAYRRPPARRSSAGNAGR